MPLPESFLWEMSNQWTAPGKPDSTTASLQRDSSVHGWWEQGMASAKPLLPRETMNYRRANSTPSPTMSSYMLAPANPLPVAKPPSKCRPKTKKVGFGRAYSLPTIPEKPRQQQERRLTIPTQVTSTYLPKADRQSVAAQHGSKSKAAGKTMGSHVTARLCDEHHTVHRGPHLGQVSSTQLAALNQLRYLDAVGPSQLIMPRNLVLRGRAAQIQSYRVLPVFPGESDRPNTSQLLEQVRVKASEIAAAAEKLKPGAEVHARQSAREAAKGDNVRAANNATGNAADNTANFTANNTANVTANVTDYNSANNTADITADNVAAIEANNTADNTGQARSVEGKGCTTTQSSRTAHGQSEKPVRKNESRGGKGNTKPRKQAAKREPTFSAGSSPLTTEFPPSDDGTFPYQDPFVGMSGSFLLRMKEIGKRMGCSRDHRI